MIGIPGGIVGHILAGVLVNRFKMKTANIFKFNVLYCLLVCVTVPSVFLYCPNRAMAGVTVPYRYARSSPAQVFERVIFGV